MAGRVACHRTAIDASIPCSRTSRPWIVVPIAVSAAIEAGISVQPVAMLVAVAGAASFLTPIATPANLMVMTPGGYRFGDYWKLCLPITVMWLAIALLVIPMVWRFRHAGHAAQVQLWMDQVATQIPILMNTDPTSEAGASILTRLTAAQTMPGS